MRYFINQKITVLLVAIATGVFTQAGFAGPDASGTAPGNTATSSGSATGGVNNSTINNNTGTTAPPQNSTSSSTTTQGGAATTSDGQSGTAVAPSGQVTTPPPAPGTTGSATSDTTVNGTTNYNQNQRYPTYRGTDSGPSIRSYSDHPHEPPHIIGTVSGVNGVQYYISEDGYMYSREHDGKFRRFGRFQRHGPNDTLYGTTVTPETIIPGTTDTGTGAVAPVAPASPSDTTTVAPGTVAPSGNDADEARRRAIDDEERRRTLAADADYQQQLQQQKEREKRQSEEDDRTRFRITGRIVGDDGQVYYMGSNGYVYYRAGDGHLHMVGGGVPE